MTVITELINQLFNAIGNVECVSDTPYVSFKCRTKLSLLIRNLISHCNLIGLRCLQQGNIQYLLSMM